MRWRLKQLQLDSFLEANRQEPPHPTPIPGYIDFASPLYPAVLIYGYVTGVFGLYPSGYRICTLPQRAPNAGTALAAPLRQPRRRSAATLARAKRQALGLALVQSVMRCFACAKNMQNTCKTPVNH